MGKSRPYQRTATGSQQASYDKEPSGAPRDSSLRACCCVSELQADGIDTQLILREAGHPSPFTYIIVDRAGKTGFSLHITQHV